MNTGIKYLVCMCCLILGCAMKACHRGPIKLIEKISRKYDTLLDRCEFSSDQSKCLVFLKDFSLQIFNMQKNENDFGKLFFDSHALSRKRVRLHVAGDAKKVIASIIEDCVPYKGCCVAQVKVVDVETNAAIFCVDPRRLGLSRLSLDACVFSDDFRYCLVSISAKECKVFDLQKGSVADDTTMVFDSCKELKYFDFACVKLLYNRYLLVSHLFYSKCRIYDLATQKMVFNKCFPERTSFTLLSEVGVKTFDGKTVKLFDLTEENRVLLESDIAFFSISGLDAMSHNKGIIIFTCKSVYGKFETVLVYDVKKAKEVYKTVLPCSVKQAYLSENKKHLIIMAEDLANEKGIFVLGLQTKQVLFNSYNTGKKLLFSKKVNNGSQYAIAYEDGSIYKLDMSNLSVDMVRVSQLGDMLKKHQSQLCYISKNGERIAIQYAENLLHVFDLHNSKKLIFSCNKKKVSFFRLGKTGKYLYLLFCDGEFVIVDLDKPGQEEKKILFRRNNVNRCTLNKDEKYIALCFSDDSFTLFEIKDGKQKKDYIVAPKSILGNKGGKRSSQQKARRGKGSVILQDLRRTGVKRKRAEDKEGNKEKHDYQPVKKKIKLKV